MGGGGAGRRRFLEQGIGALSIQELAEFYAAATRKLGMTSAEAEAVIRDLGSWIILRPSHADLLKAAQFERRYKLGWWDALILTNAIELGCAVLWTEDFSDGQRFGPVTIRNPFRWGGLEPAVEHYLAAAGMFSRTQSSFGALLRVPVSKAMRRPSG